MVRLIDNFGAATGPRQPAAATGFIVRVSMGSSPHSLGLYQTSKLDHAIYLPELESRMIAPSNPPKLRILAGVMVRKEKDIPGRV